MEPFSTTWIVISTGFSLSLSLSVFVLTKEKRTGDQEEKILQRSKRRFRCADSFVRVRWYISSSRSALCAVIC